ncbi:aminoglycoside phosphotransferase family protein [Actinomadura soli]|uniref:aminoglycoside phosphotransferase family protein n=1 Tax=Actinomadura soli TaxID=2508997 RepID=UPI00148690C6|nr:aminoglycoside phosphotransferase family protein [Actinomadura soli]
MILLQQVCAAAGLDARDAVRLAGRANAVYRLPHANAVARLRQTHNSPEWDRRMATSVKVTRWLAERDYPTVQPLDAVPQPVTVNGWTVTFWQYEPPGEDATSANATDLARLLRRLHTLQNPPIELPATDPLGSLPIDLHQHPEALTTQQRDWLLRRCADIAAAYPTAPMPPELDHGLIHGDAHTGNLIPTCGGYVVCDWDSVSHGSRAQDLIPSLYRVVRLGSPRSTWLEMCSAYGIDPDLEHHPGMQLLYRAREIRALAAYVRAASRSVAAKAELDKRMRTLMTGEDAIWHAPQGFQ